MATWWKSNLTEESSDVNSNVSYLFKLINKLAENNVINDLKDAIYNTENASTQKEGADKELLNKLLEHGTSLPSDAKELVNLVVLALLKN